MSHFKTLSDEDLARVAETCRLAFLKGRSPWFTLLLLYGLIAGIGGLALMFDSAYTSATLRATTFSGLVAFGIGLYLDRQHLRAKASAESTWHETLAEQERRRQRHG